MHARRRLRLLPTQIIKTTTPATKTIQINWYVWELFRIGFYVLYSCVCVFVYIYLPFGKAFIAKRTIYNHRMMTRAGSSDDSGGGGSATRFIFRFLFPSLRLFSFFVVSNEYG